MFWGFRVQGFGLCALGAFRVLGFVLCGLGFWFLGLVHRGCRVLGLCFAGSDFWALRFGGFECLGFWALRF